MSSSLVVISGLEAPSWSGPVISFPSLKFSCVFWPSIRDAKIHWAQVIASIAGACTRSIYFRHWKKRLGPLLETSTVMRCSQAQCTWKLAGKIWRIDPSNGYWRKWRWFIGGFGCTLLSKNWNCRIFSVGIFPKFLYLPFLRSQRVPVFLVGRLTLRAPCPRKLANIAWCRGCAAKCRCTFLAKLKSWRTPSRGNWNQALWSLG